jgi:hypothetical protein
MTKRVKADTTVDVAKRIRDGFGLAGEHYYTLLRKEKTGVSVVSTDTPKTFVALMRMVLRKIEPQLTEGTRPLYDEMTRLVEEIEKERPRHGKWHPPMPRESKASIRADTATYTAKREEVMRLLDEADLLHRTEPATAAREAQAAYRQAQSARASQPRKLNEDQQRRIAKCYWDAKQDGSFYGTVKRLAAEYDVSQTTIQSTAKKYKPN